MKRFFFLTLILSLFLVFSYGLNIEKFLPQSSNFLIISKNMEDLNRVFFRGMSRVLAQSKKNSEWQSLLKNKDVKKINFAVGLSFPKDIKKGNFNLIVATSFKDKKVYKDFKGLIFKEITENGKKSPAVKLSEFMIYNFSNKSGEKFEIGCYDKKKILLLGNEGAVKRAVSDYLAGEGLNINLKKEIFSNLSDGNLENKLIAYIDFGFLKGLVNGLLENMGKGKEKKVAFTPQNKENPFSNMFEKFFTKENLEKFVDNSGLLKVKYYFLEIKDEGKFYGDREILKLKDPGETFLGKISSFYKEDKYYKEVLKNVPVGYKTVVFSRFPFVKILDNLKTLLSDSFGPQMENLTNGFLGMADMQTSIYIGLTTSDILNLIGNDFLSLSNYKGDISDKNSLVQIFFPKDIKLIDKMVKALRGMKYRDLKIEEKKLNESKIYIFNYKTLKFPILVDQNFWAFSPKEASLLKLEENLKNDKCGIEEKFSKLIEGKDLVSLSYGDVLFLKNNSIFRLFKNKGKMPVTKVNSNIKPNEIFSNYRYSYLNNFDLCTEGKLNKNYFSCFVDGFVESMISVMKKKKEKIAEGTKEGAKTGEK